MPTAAETITTAISDPASASADGQSVTARPAPDTIALLNYYATLSVIGNRRRGIRVTKQTNPGALEDTPPALGTTPFNRV